jgi:signal recognition particle subunit SRP54
MDELVALLQPPTKAATSTGVISGETDDTTTSNTTTSTKNKKAAITNRSKAHTKKNSIHHTTMHSNNPLSTIRRGVSNVIVMVGLQGAGKTTTIGKLAQYYIKKQYKVGIICADTFRAGAFDQLKQNATKLRIPFYGSYHDVNPIQIAVQGVQQFKKDHYEIIIIDTSGRHKQENALFDEMSDLITTVQPNLTVLVVDATQGQSVYDQALAFHQTIPVGCVIVTKLDGHAKGGGALSAVAATQSPIIFTGTGEHFDDLEVFHAESFVQQLLGFGNLRGLMDVMNSDGDDTDPSKKQAEMIEKLQKGQYTLRDMYQHVEKMVNIGSLNKITSMIPGMSDFVGANVSPGQDEEQKYRLRRFMIIMDSMTNAELDGLVTFSNYVQGTDPNTESRIKRIARGAGCHVNEVKMTLQAHAQFATMFGKYGKMAAAAGGANMMGGGAANHPMLKGQQQQFMQRMKKNPQATMNQMLNSMDPSMIQSMGGRQQVMAMMEQMANGGGAAGGMDPMSMMMNGGAGGMGGMDVAAMMKNMM